MNRRNTSGSIILFSWKQCPKCLEVKNLLQPRINNGSIIVYDLDSIKNNIQLMGLFRKISPQSNIPALVVIRNNQVFKSAIGIAPIKKLIENI